MHLGSCNVEPWKIDFLRDLDVGFFVFVDREKVRNTNLFESSCTGEFSPPENGVLTQAGAHLQVCTPVTGFFFSFGFSLEIKLIFCAAAVLYRGDVSVWVENRTCLFEKEKKSLRSILRLLAEHFIRGKVSKHRSLQDQHCPFLPGRDAEAQEG